MENIKIFLTDCDGVLTDGGMYYFNNGLEAKKFNTRDGMGLSILRKQGIKIGIISGEKNNIIKDRSQKLKMDYLYMGITNKKEVLDTICKENNINYGNVLYVGDDLNDIEILKTVGFSCCPSNACSEVKNICNYICNKNGGDGVIREIVDIFFKREDKNEQKVA